MSFLQLPRRLRPFTLEKGDDMCNVQGVSEPNIYSAAAHVLSNVAIAAMSRFVGLAIRQRFRQT